MLVKNFIFLNACLGTKGIIKKEKDLTKPPKADKHKQKYSWGFKQVALLMN